MQTRPAEKGLPEKGASEMKGTAKGSGSGMGQWTPITKASRKSKPIADKHDWAQAGRAPCQFQESMIVIGS